MAERSYAFYDAPEYAPGMRPGRSKYPVQSFGRPMLSDPLAAYALPTSGPAPRASHNQYPYLRRQPVFIGGESGQPYQHVREYSDNEFKEDETLTDASLESDINDALSGDSFTFESSMKAHDGSGDLAYPATEETESMDSTKPEKPNPYSSTDLHVLHSCWNGDPVARWDCKATLSTLPTPKSLRTRNQESFRWMCV